MTTAANREAITLGSQTATVENLYSVGNVRDEQELVTGTVTRKNAACIYDGTQPVGDRYISSTGAKDNGAIIIYPLETEYTGDSIVSFTETVKQDVNSLEVRIEPTQDLHGYDHPWPAGGGKNIIPTDLATLRARNTGGTWTDNKYVHNGLTFTVNPDGTITVNGTATAETFLSYIDVSIAIPLTAGSYILHGIGSSDINVFAGKDGAWWGEAKTSNKTLTSSSDFTFAVASQIPSGKSFTDFVLRPMFEKGDTASAWEPNSNVCPISGLTGLSVYRTGKNLLNVATNITGKYISSNGSIAEGSDAQYTDLIPVKAGEIYVCRLVSGRNSGHNRWHAYDANGTWVKQLADANVTGLQGEKLTRVVTIDSGISYMRLSYGINDTDAMISPATSKNWEGYYPIKNYASSRAGIDTSTVIQSPYTTPASNRGPAVLCEVEQEKIYVVESTVTADNGFGMGVTFYASKDDVTNNTNAIGKKSVDKPQGIFEPVSGAAYAVICCSAGAGTTFTFDPNSIKVFYVDADYEPYNGNTYNVDWTSQVGTVYGCTVDPVTGQLTVKFGMLDLGAKTYTFAIRNTGDTGNIFLFQDSAIKSTGGGNVICSQLMTYHGSQGVDMPVNSCFVAGGHNLLVCTTDADAASVKASLSGVQLCYELSTPVTYQLTPQEVETLVGTNNIFSPDATSIKVAVSNPVIEYVAPQPLTLAEGSNTVSAINLSVSSVPLELNYISKVAQPTPTFQSKTVSPSTSQ